MSEFTKEQWRQEMLDEAMQDDLFTRLMKNDDDYFFEYSKYAHGLLVTLKEFRDECEHFDRDFKEELRSLI